MSEAWDRLCEIALWQKFLREWPIFANNIVVACALCRSFELGVNAGCSWMSGQLDGQNAWEPGCGRPMRQAA